MEKNMDYILGFLNSNIKYEDRTTEKKFIDTFINEHVLKGYIPKSALWAGLKITSKCNMSCIHCWVNEREEDKTLEEIKKGIDNLSKLEVLHITISGGEPLVRNDLLEILKYIKKKNICIEIFSNGYLLNEDIIIELEKILNKDTDTIQISLDACNQITYAKQRNHNGFEKILNNIKLIKKHNFNVRANFTATHINIGELYETYNLCNELKVDTFSVSHVFDLHRGADLYSKVGFEKYIEQIVLCIKSSEKFVTKLRVFTPIEGISSVAKSRSEALSNSKVIDSDIPIYWFIHSNGDIYPSVKFELEEFKIGNIYEDCPDKISEQHKKISKLLMFRDLKNQKCIICNKFEICRAGDSSRAYKNYASINHPDPKCMFNMEV